MGIPVVVVASRGLPVTLTSNGTGSPMTIATNGFGIPVTVVASGGMPVTGFTTGPDVTAPVITASNTLTVAENSVLTHYLMANEAVTWAKVGGADQALFTLASGVLTLPAKDYEAPDDADANNTYVVQVQATDAASNVSAVQTITVTITNVTEAPSLTLTWTSADTVLDPVFALTFYDAEVGDVLTLEVDDSSGFGSLHDSEANTLDSTELAAGTITYSGFTTLAVSTTYYARVKLERGVATPVYSNTVSKLMSSPDVLAPTLSAPTDTKTGSSTATITVDTNEGNGTLYWVLSSSITTPTAAQIIAGQMHTGAAAAKSGNVAVVGTGTQTVNCTALAGSTTYYAHFAHRDAASNTSAAVSGNGFTTDAATGWTSPLDASTPAVFWVDASNSGSITATGGVANGNLVTQWNDLAAGGHHLTPALTPPVYTTGVLNGLPGLATAGTSGLRSTSFVVAQPIMVVAVWKQPSTAPGTQAMLIDGDVAGAGARFIITNRWTGGNYQTFAGTLVDQGVAVAINTAYHSRAIFNGSSSSSKLNASVVTGTNPGTGGIINGLALSVSSYVSQAIYCEVYVIPNPTAGDITNSDAYVLAKWGV